MRRTLQDSVSPTLPQVSLTQWVVPRFTTLLYYHSVAMSNSPADGVWHRKEQPLDCSPGAVRQDLTAGRRLN